ncbi:MAG TPA: metallophosphoesterase [Methanoregulaceae archaeon]|nr:metallophosphoesterase [Methanoregulaceae archaeon]
MNAGKARQKRGCAVGGVPGRPLPSPVMIALDPGFASWALRQQARRVARRFGRTPLEPLIPLCGPFLPDPGAGLASVRAALDSAVPPVPFLACELDGYAARPDGRGGLIGLSVRPSAGLLATADAIDRAIGRSVPGDGRMDGRLLLPVARFDDRAGFFGAARALGLVRSPWDRLRQLLRAPPPVPAVHPVRRPLDVTRLLLLAGERPVAGLDLAPRRWLHAAELRDRETSAAALRAYRLARGYELSAPSTRPGAPRETWLFGDLHLGHPEISLYCGRPFPGGDPTEHDRVLVRNWRHTVRPDDRAVLLGDVCASADPDAYREAIRRLPGRLALVRGNHDPALPGLVPCLPLEADGVRFLAVHDPGDAPDGFDGWVIHGHHHGADLDRFPFFDPVVRRINVSVETAGYSPVPLSLLCRLIREGSGRIAVRETAPT